MQSWLHLNGGPAAAGLMRWKSGDRVILVCFSLGVLCIQVNGEEISFVLNIYLHMSFSHFVTSLTVGASHLGTAV